MDQIVVGILIGASVAAVTALLATLTEAFKGRWAANEGISTWRREKLVVFAHSYVETAFAIAGISSNARRERLANVPLEDTQRHLTECEERHRAMIEALSAIRLVAPREVILCAEAVHDSSHALINNALGRRQPNSDEATSDAAWRRLKEVALKDRRNLINAIRKAFGLDSHTEGFEASVESSWSVPADDWCESDHSKLAVVGLEGGAKEIPQRM